MPDLHAGAVVNYEGRHVHRISSAIHITGLFRSLTTVVVAERMSGAWMYELVSGIYLQTHDCTCIILFDFVFCPVIIFSASEPSEFILLIFLYHTVSHIIANFVTSRYVLGTKTLSVRSSGWSMTPPVSKCTRTHVSSSPLFACLLVCPRLHTICADDNHLFMATMCHILRL